MVASNGKARPLLSGSWRELVSENKTPDFRLKDQTFRLKDAFFGALLQR